MTLEVLAESPPREQMLINAPPRPGRRERATIKRAFEAHWPNLKTAWQSPDYDVFLVDMTEAVGAATEPWGMAVKLTELGWGMNHDSYMCLVGFWRSLETARIEREVEWVIANGIRFPAKVGQCVVFSQRGAYRCTGQVMELDGIRGRAIVSVKRHEKPADNVAVLAESVMMVHDGEPSTQ